MKIHNSNRGKLYLFPVSLGNKDFSVCLPEGNKLLLNSCRTFIVEDIRTARRFFKEAGYAKSIDETTFHLLNKHTLEGEIPSFLDSIEEGENIGILSESGLPCIADPGAWVVAIAQKRQIEVIPLVGPSSLLLALMASGFNGQNFAFAGYLPIDKDERRKQIKELENLAYKKDQTQIFIETPYRNDQMMSALLQTCQEQTLICVAVDIMLENQSIVTKSVKDWKRQIPVLNKRNTVFLIYRQE